MKPLIFATTALILLSGCAAMPPSAESLAQTPVVRFGETPPVNKDYVLHFTAGQPIPVKLSVVGNAFQQPGSETVRVSLVRDIYVHKNWMSYDRRNWIDANQALDLKMDVHIPSYEYPHDGIVRILMDFKK